MSGRKMAGGYANIAAGIAEVLDVFEAGGFKDLANRTRLVVAMLEQQPATRLQVGARITRDGANIVQSFRSGGQCAARFESHIAPFQVRVVLADVGRVGHHDIERLPRDGLPPRPFAKFHLQAEIARVAACDGERRGAGVGCGDGGQRTFGFQRQGQRAAAGAEIENADAGVRRAYLQRRFHQRLGIGARNQRIRGNGQWQRPEFAATENMCHRFAAFTPRDVVAERVERDSLQRFLGPCKQVAARFLQRRGKQDLGIQARRIAVTGESCRCGIQPVAEIVGAVFAGCGHGVLGDGIGSRQRIL